MTSTASPRNVQCERSNSRHWPSTKVCPVFPFSAFLRSPSCPRGSRASSAAEHRGGVRSGQCRLCGDGEPCWSRLREEKKEKKTDRKKRKRKRIMRPEEKLGEKCSSIAGRKRPVLPSSLLPCALPRPVEYFNTQRSSNVSLWL